MPELSVSDIARRGMSAHRSGYASLVMDEDMEKMLGLSQTEQDTESEEQEEELAALSTIASLKDHPGYQKMRDVRLKTISHYRSGAFLKASLTDSSIDDTHFGQLARLGMLVADELEKELNTVEAADEAVQQEKAKRNARQRQQPERA